MKYNPELLVFKEASHRYYYDGKAVPSVTTILGIIGKDALVPWAAKIAAERFARDLTKFNSESSYMTVDDIERMRASSAKSFSTDGKEGARLGTLVHESIEDHLNSSKTPPKAALGYVNAFKDWWDEEKKSYDIVALEHRLFHHQYLYAGTCDMILRNKITNSIKVVDYKTSKRSKYAPWGIYPEYLLQAAAYAEAWNASTDSLRDSCVETTILNVAADGTYLTCTRDTFDISQDWQTFRQAQVLRENLKALEQFVKPEKKKKKNYDFPQR